MYALDTNSLIYFFKGKGRVAQRLLAQSPSTIAIPAVVLYELETGLAKSTSPQQRREQLDALLQVVQVLPLGPREARVAATLRARLEAQGTPIDPMDALIAGTALAHGATLMTHSMREFERVPGLDLVDWY